MKRIFATGAALSACVMIAPGAALAQTTKHCPNVSFSHDTNYYKYFGIRVTDIGCAPASKILIKGGKTDKIPTGWTFSDTEAKYNATTGTTVYGFAYKRGSQRIVWHVTH